MSWLAAEGLGSDEGRMIPTLSPSLPFAPSSRQGGGLVQPPTSPPPPSRPDRGRALPGLHLRRSRLDERIALVTGRQGAVAGKGDALEADLLLRLQVPTGTSQTPRGHQ